MPATVDRANRAVLLLLGLLLVGGGGLGLARGFYAFSNSAAHEPLITQAERSFVHRNAGWFWLVVAVGSLVIALLALRWVIAQLSTQRVGTLRLEPDRSAGDTTLQSRALTDAVTDELEGYRGVRGASARLIGVPEEPDLLLTVDLDGRADFGEVRRRVEHEAIPHLRQAVGLERLPIRLRLRVAPAPERQPA